MNRPEIEQKEGVVPPWIEKTLKEVGVTPQKESFGACIRLVNCSHDQDERPLLEERVKNYPKVQWLLDKYTDKAYPIIDKHDIEGVLTELLDDIDRWKSAYHTMEINFNNECESHAADNERNENSIKELKESMEQCKSKNMSLSREVSYLETRLWHARREAGYPTH